MRVQLWEETVSGTEGEEKVGEDGEKKEKDEEGEGRKEGEAESSKGGRVLLAEGVAVVKKLLEATTRPEVSVVMLSSHCIDALHLTHTISYGADERWFRGGVEARATTISIQCCSHRSSQAYCYYEVAGEGMYV